MKRVPKITSSRLFAAAFLSTPLMLTAPAAIACPNGSCSPPPNPVVLVRNQVQSAKGVVEKGSLAAAYTRIQAVAQDAENRNIANNSDVRAMIGTLVKTLQNRSQTQFNQAVTDYFEGRREQALATFTELAALEGLPAATQAVNELRKEEDRAAWRELQNLAREQINTGAYVAARETLADLKRLARSTGYKDQTDTLCAQFSETLAPRIEQAIAAIGQERFDEACPVLIEISRLTTLRGPSANARQALRQHASIPGMRQAKAEYDSGQSLADIQQRISENVAPSPQELASYRDQLKQLTVSFPGTQAANQAQQLLTTLAQQYASR